MEPARARKIARVLVLVPFFAIASAFIVLSVIQLAEQTFFAPRAPIAAPRSS